MSALPGWLRRASSSSTSTFLRRRRMGTLVSRRPTITLLLRAQRRWRFSIDAPVFQAGITMSFMKIALSLLLSVLPLAAQDATGTPDAHIAAAKAAAGEDFQNLF